MTSKKPERDASTYFSRTLADQALELGGRFSATAAVVGSTPNAGALYPAASVPNADVGAEPPLGESVEAVEPVGNPAEVAASIEREEHDAILNRTAPPTQTQLEPKAQ
jgi:hypothetical protein